MKVDVMEKPQFNVDQVVPASVAARRFGEVRKNAKIAPQFISDNNRIDTVVQSYEAYEKMFMELEILRELAWEYNLSLRIQDADQNPNRYSLKEVMGDHGFAEFQKVNPDDIADDDLFG
ncbi:hypothetical protein [Sporosarcina sp. YIM B06819]|uniref:hypothetical protein n=1 Tax=Sporosarcina sp. YIM B06819 TaxID=3081769 RepID=UPI00298BECFB|nr:hypothetical protein [Sporosarcina sp. YIM B06819]